MKMIIAGGRKYQFTDKDYAELDKIHKIISVTEVVSGKAKGADTCGEVWAKKNGIKVADFPAEWTKFGKAAGPIRNLEMAKYADALAVSSGNDGTSNMVKNAKKEGLEIFYLSSFWDSEASKVEE